MGGILFDREGLELMLENRLEFAALRWQKRARKYPKDAFAWFMMSSHLSNVSSSSFLDESLE